MASVSNNPDRKGLSYRGVIAELCLKNPRPPLDQIVKTLKEEFPRRANRDHKKEIAKTLGKLFKGKLKTQRVIEETYDVPDKPIEIKGVGKFEPKKQKDKVKEKAKEVTVVNEDEEDPEVKPAKAEKAKTAKIEKPKAKSKKAKAPEPEEAEETEDTEEVVED